MYHFLVFFKFNALRSWIMGAHSIFGDGTKLVPGPA